MAASPAALASAVLTTKDCMRLTTEAAGIKPPALVRSNLVPYPIEVDLAGYKIGPHWEPHRTYETYEYLIVEVDGVQDVWVAPHYVGGDFAAEQWVASHRSLYNRVLADCAERGCKGEPVVLAAGQLGVKFGIWARLDNRSGEFGGSPAHLAYAQQTFESLGIVFGDRARIIDFSVENIKDPEEYHKRRIDLLQYVNTEKFQADRRYFDEIFAKLYAVAPHPLHEGLINENVFDVILHLDVNGGLPIDQSLLWFYVNYFNESLDFMVYKVGLRLDQTELTAGLEQLIQHYPNFDFKNAPVFTMPP